MQVERIIVNFNPVFGLRNRPRGLKRFSCFSRKRTDLSKKKLHGVCTLTKVYQYAKEERFLFFEPCRTLVDICLELLIRTNQLPQSTGGKLADALKNCRPTKLILVVSPQKIPLKNWKKKYFQKRKHRKEDLILS